MNKPASFWMLEPLRKYAVFRGRARRAEYWWYALLYGLLAVATTIADFIVFGLPNMLSNPSVGPITGLLGLALLIPSFAVTVRRLHDTDRSGWWVLLGLIPFLGGLILFIWFCTRGSHGANRYGTDPRG
ncbi:DUF805 domain-containing protein [Polymorphobacter multimanifer]|uniref:Uncharacterized membrane protein YhaH (DUF805 family) n=1 Tax=Polymorphobacter multimanifer TaxID=1070431 RepID=A0A841LC23_9SPHN|nr:DUF805 domain-containing protein [Polymorphobacter multimanifer]MBB6227365.1 uncharacterized membrane protein YhaH (DUF805 family) [Polymorphobacter multimanifer]GGI92869.1 DUF805 domain-containing protein [Polymorphobacter multimanifer]